MKIFILLMSTEFPCHISLVTAWDSENVNYYSHLNSHGTLRVPLKVW